MRLVWRGRLRNGPSILAGICCFHLKTSAFLPVDQIRQIASFLPARSTEVVVYFRPPLTRFISGYKRHVKSNKTRCQTGLLEFMERWQYERVVDYHAIVARWASVFGIQAINVRSFDLAKKSLIHDFFSAISVPVSDLPAPSIASNISPDDLSIAALAILNKIERSDKDHTSVMNALWDTSRAEERDFSLLKGDHYPIIRDRLLKPIADFPAADNLGLSIEPDLSKMRPISSEALFERIRRLEKQI